MKEQFTELKNEELQTIDGGIAWALIGLGALCVGAFALGVYNGYKGND